MTEEVRTTGQGEKPQTYRLPETAITDELRATIASKIGQEAVAYPAKVGGSYKGPVIHADDSFVVQAVGRDRNSAVVHQRSDLEMQGAQLRQRDRQNDLTDRNVQVHYRGTTAKVFPLNTSREGNDSSPPQPPALDRDALLATAADYARDAFKNGKQREAFVGHLAAMLDTNRTISPTQPTPASEQPAVARKAALTQAAPAAQPVVQAEPAR